MKQSIQALLLALFFAQVIWAQSGNGLSFCTSSCSGTLGENIYPNGDFGSGIPNMVQSDPGLAPGYLYQVNPPPNDGYYSISNNTTPWGWFAANVWIDIEDNGPEPNGYMMVINASYPPGLFFQNTVQVCENTLYEFSVDVVNLIESSQPQLIRPNLSFLIDGIAYCETGNIPPDEKWHTVRFSFTTAPGQTSVVLAMRNNAPGGNGNDLAIDNISFRACGPEIQTSSVVSFCKGSQTLLDAKLLNTPFLNAAYQWQMLVNGIWEDIPGATSNQWLVQNPEDGAQFRMLVASALPNLTLSSCRVVSAVIQLQQLPDLTPQTQAQAALCFGQSSGSVFAQSLTGMAPYSFIWENGVASDTLSGLVAGTYTVTITDAMGCTGTGTAIVAEPSPVTSEITLQPVSCHGEADAWIATNVGGGSPPYQFEWGNGATTSLVQNLVAGLYHLTISDANACTNSHSISISEPQVLLAAVQASSVLCFGGNSASAEATVVGGTAPYAYSWSSGQTTAQISGLMSGVYSATITDVNGCLCTGTALVAEPSSVTSEITFQPVSCHGEADAWIATNVGGGSPPYQFVWGNGATTSLVQDLVAGLYQLTISDANACTNSHSISITEPQALLAAVQASSVLCFGGNPASAEATAVGGTAPYAYFWSSGQTTAQINNLMSGVYSVTVTDVNGCTDAISGNVTVPDLLTASTGATAVSCFSGNDAEAFVTPAGGVPPYAFIWSSGQTASLVTGLSAGQYNVTVLDANACVTTETVLVLEPPVLLGVANANPALCFGSSTGSATVEVQGGNAPYHYSWNNGQTSAALAGLEAGPYGVTITDTQGCTTSSLVQVQQPDLLVIQTNQEAVSCAGGADGAITTQSSGGLGSYTYAWSNGESSASIGNLTAGTYTLIATDANGCSQVTSMMVPEPNPLQSAINQQDVSCFGSSDASAVIGMVGGTPPYSYVWNTGNTGSALSQIAAGNYTVTAVDAHGCSQSASVSIGQPSPLISNIQTQEPDCFGHATGSLSAVALGGMPPYTFLWQTGETSNQLIGVPAGLYAYSISDANQCQFSQQIWLTQPTALVVDPQALPVSCPEVSDGSLQATAQGGTAPYLYSWSNGFSGAFIQDLAMGVYTVTATDAKGCSAVVESAIYEALVPEIDLGLDQTLNLGEELVLTAFTNLPSNEILDYAWSGSGGELQCPDCHRFQFLPLGSGCQEVLVRTVKGCKATDELCFTVISGRKLYVPNVFTPDDSGENDFFTIYSDASVSHIQYLKIFSRWGEQLFVTENIRTNDEPAGWSGLYQGKPMNPGVFVWVAAVEFIDGEVLLLKGDVTLLR